MPGRAILKKGTDVMGSLHESAKANIFDDIFVNGGEMGRLMRSMDWSQTPLGPVERWPQSLRTALSICLASRFPILIWWGPELVKLYNDAYRPMLGTTKHPQAMGQRGQECWPEIWDLIGPMLEGVLKEGRSTWSDNQLLPLDRNGYVEECYFTFSYSPIRDETGGIGGVFTAVTETTNQVLGERRLRTLRELAERSTEAKTSAETSQIIIETLAKNRADMPFALLYLLNKDGKQASLDGATGLVPNTPVSPPIIDLEQEALPEGETSGSIWRLAKVIETGKAEFINHLPTDFSSFLRSPELDPPRSALVLPITKSGQESLYGFLVVGVSSRRALDKEYYGFFELVAGQVAANIAHLQAYQEGRKRLEALAELNRAKTTFFSNVSHEFRTPLTLLLGPIDDMRQNEAQALSPQQRERVEVIYRNGQRLLKLVNTLLDFSRLEAGRIQASYEATDLAALTTELASSFREVITMAGMQLVIDCPPLSTPIYVDHEMWEKIVLNLLSNAFKFTFEGQITVRLYEVDQHIELAVQDTGVGIACEELPHIFERFHRIRGVRARTIEGSGIGLSLVQELTLLHGGTVRVNSTPEQGSTFTIALPSGSAHLPADQIATIRTMASTAIGVTPYIAEALRWLPNPPAPTATILSSEMTEASSSPFPFQETPLINTRRPEQAATQAATTILLVDDNADMRDYLQRLLRPHYTVEVAADSRAALEIVRQRVPDLVLSDVMMPDLDGFQLLRTLRSDPRTRIIPIILLSARAGTEAAVEGMEAGADDYLIKPFSARELLARIAARLEIYRMRTGIAQQARQHAHRLQQLAQAAITINSMLPIEEVLTFITRKASEIIGTHQAATAVLADHNWSEVLHTTYLSEKYAAWRTYDEKPNGLGIYAYVCRTNQPIRLTHTELKAHPAWCGFSHAAEKHPPLRGWLAVPLIRRDGRNLGVIHLSDKYEGEFTEEDEAILIQLAQIASIAIENIQLYQQAQEAIQARNQFILMISHDLKNPLGAIKGYAQLIQRVLRRISIEGTASERLTTSLVGIDTTVLRMTGLINELLDLAHLQAGQPLQLNYQSADLVSIIRQVVAEQQHIARQHRICIETTVEELRGSFDMIRLERTFSNLLSNAIKYSPKESEIMIKIEQTARQEREGTEAVIAVQDQGMGIPAKDLPHIFEQFRRGENVLGKLPGTGLGLASARHIIEKHGGTVTVISQEGVGSTFTVRLPLD